MISWIGSIAPDIDSDHATPLLILWSFVSMAVVLFLIQHNIDLVVYDYIKQHIPANVNFDCKPLVRGLFFFVVFLLINGFDWNGNPFPICLRYAFQKWTVHRGITHSILGVIFAHQSAYSIFMHIGSYNALVYANALCYGWICHLVLDLKIHSGTNEGKFWKPGQNMFPFKLAVANKGRAIFFFVLSLSS